MKILVRLAALALLGVVAWSRPLHFHPAPGSTLTKRLASEGSVQLDKLEIAIDGRKWWTGSSLDASWSQQLAVTDTYLALQGGRPSALDRRYDRIAQSLESSLGVVSSNPEWQSMSGTSELEGAVVTFRLEEGAYAKRFGRSDRFLEPVLLEGLTEDMDLRVLLPVNPVSVGDEWELDPASLADLLSPGGSFAWTIETGGAPRVLGDALDPVLMGELRQVLSAMLEGRVGGEVCERGARALTARHHDRRQGDEGLGRPHGARHADRR